MQHKYFKLLIYKSTKTERIKNHNLIVNDISTNNIKISKNKIKDTTIKIDNTPISIPKYKRV